MGKEVARIVLRSWPTISGKIRLVSPHWSQYAYFVFLDRPMEPTAPKTENESNPFESDPKEWGVGRTIPSPSFLLLRAAPTVILERFTAAALCTTPCIRKRFLP